MKLQIFLIYFYRLSDTETRTLSSLTKITDEEKVINKIGNQ